MSILTDLYIVSGGYVMSTKSLPLWQRRIFILCWIAYSFAYFCRVNLSVTLTSIQQAFKWNNTSIGFISTALFWVYAIGQLVNGHLGDKISSRLLVSLGLFVSAAINIVFGFTKSLPMMVVLWGINGFFQSMLWGPIMETLSHWYPRSEGNGVAIAISTTGVAGYLLAWGLCGYILLRTSWQYVFWIPGCIVLIFSVIWCVLMRDRPEEVGLSLGSEEASEPDYRQTDVSCSMTLPQLILKAKLLPIGAACMMQGLIKDSITIWGPKFMMDTQHLPLNSTLRLVVIIPIVNFFGVILAGWLNRKLPDQEKLTSLILYSAGVLASLGLFIFSNINAYLSLAFLSCSSALMSGANTILLSIVPLKYARYKKVSAVAGFLDFSVYIGSGATGFLTGLIVDSGGWNHVFAFWVMASLAGALIILFSWLDERKSNSCHGSALSFVKK